MNISTLSKSFLFGLVAIASIWVVVIGQKLSATPTTSLASRTLGQLLFFDEALSRTGNQSCASCHEPGNAFIDTRETVAGRAVSIGDDLKSFGNRNTPSIAYAAHTPDFSKDSEGYLGGFFLDGRATTLEDQSVEPFINPLEMALADHETLVKKVLENPA